MRHQQQLLEANGQYLPPTATEGESTRSSNGKRGLYQLPALDGATRAVIASTQ